jgi:hypothetical protein
MLERACCSAADMAWLDTLDFFWDSLPDADKVGCACPWVCLPLGFAYPWVVVRWLLEAAAALSPCVL